MRKENVTNNLIENKISFIKKHYKKNKLILDLEMINYENHNFYIRVDYYKKIDAYKISWFDLDLLEIDKIEKFISYEYIPNDLINLFMNIFNNNEISKFDLKKENITDGLVKLNIYQKVRNMNEIHLEFTRYIPKEVHFLSTFFVVLFQNLPKKLECFLDILHAEILGKINSYEYQKAFAFDLFNGSLNEVFVPHILERGVNYLEEERVTFLERINDIYFAVVEGNYKYVVSIKYNEKTKEVQALCSCPCDFHCKHICAVMLAIRKQKFNKFYKVIYRDPNVNMLDRMMSMNCFLCTGVVNGHLEIILNGHINYFPILDENGKNNWQIVEDKNGELREMMNIY